MNPRSSLVLMLAMLLAAALTWSAKPTHYLADQSEPLQLKSAIPSSFGDWHELSDASNAAIIDPVLQQQINQIYAQTLARTYANSKGQRIMLSIAYGRDQRDSLQLHQPEVCYPAQGFTLLSKNTDTLKLATHSIHITRIDTQLGNRHEPVTYWALVGKKISQGGMHKKWIEMRYNVQGYIPDGILIRVSSINTNTKDAYKIQDIFSHELLKSLPSNRVTLFSGIEIHPNR